MEMTGLIPEHSLEGDLSFVWMEKKRDPQTQETVFVPQYWLQAGAYGNTACLIKRFSQTDQLYVDQTYYKLKVNTPYRLRAEIEDHFVRLYINGELHCQYEHLTPHYSGYIGIYSYYSGKEFSDIVIHARGRPQKVDALDVPDLMVLELWVYQILWFGVGGPIRTIN